MFTDKMIVENSILLTVLNVELQCTPERVYWSFLNNINNTNNKTKFARLFGLHLTCACGYSFAVSIIICRCHRVFRTFCSCV